MALTSMVARPRPRAAPVRARFAVGFAVAGGVPARALAQEVSPGHVTIVPSTCGVEAAPLEALRAALQVELGGSTVVSIGQTGAAPTHVEVDLEPSPCAMRAPSIRVLVHVPGQTSPLESAFSLQGTPHAVRLRVIALVVAERLRQANAAGRASLDLADEPPDPVADEHPWPDLADGPADPHAWPDLAPEPPWPIASHLRADQDASRDPSARARERVSLGFDVVVRDYPSTGPTLAIAGVDGPRVFVGPRVHATYSTGRLFLRGGVDVLATEQGSPFLGVAATLALGSVGVGMRFGDASLAFEPWVHLEVGAGWAWDISPLHATGAPATYGGLVGGSIELPASVRITAHIWLSAAPSIGFSPVGLTVFEHQTIPNAVPAWVAGTSSVGFFVGGSVGLAYVL